MTIDEEPTQDITPDRAFAVLADETRLEILRSLAEAGEALPFSELFDRVDYDTSANFSYHLEKLDGHFVDETDDGYALREAGRRVVEAVLSGVVTDSSVVEPTEIDESCPFCGAPIEVSFHQEHVDMFCSACEGTFGRVGATQARDIPSDYGHLGAVHLPPAGIQNRSPVEMTRAALTWGNLELLAVSRGVCPRCSAQFDESVTVCQTHDSTEGICEGCGKRRAVQIRYRCPVCKFDEGGEFWLALWANREFLSFLTDHGINPISPSPGQFSTILSSFEEEVRSVTPFSGRFCFTIDGESLTVIVQDGLDVVDVTRHEASEPVR